MADYIEKEISSGVSLLCVDANRFKTNEIAISLALPLSKDTASANALLISLLSRKSKAYPDISLLNRKLAHLYGATLQSTVSKIGECQVIKLGLTCLDDRFSLDGESIAYESVQLLTSLLFYPKLDDNERFCAEDVEAEKRILIEKIESEENDKRVYALRKAEEIMFDGEPYAINRYGTVLQLEGLTNEDITNAWHNALSSAKIMITVVGNADTEKISTLLTDEFSKIKRTFKPLEKAVFVEKANKVKDIEEKMEVKQGKLVIGFRVNLQPDSELTVAMRTFCDIFGGGPYSKLFANVREKMSLCYYCSARYTRLKSYIMIQCGCNKENMDKALKEILSQLEEIKNGNFDDELKSSELALRDAILSVNDASEGLEVWYSNQMTDEKIKSPEEAVAENSSVTKAQVQACAKMLTLDTVYRLTAFEEGE